MRLAGERPAGLVLPVVFISSNVEGCRMFNNPMDVIEAAIRSAFTSYPREDDPIGEVRIR